MLFIKEAGITKEVATKLVARQKIFEMRITRSERRRNNDESEDNGSCTIKKCQQISTGYNKTVAESHKVIILSILKWSNKCALILLFTTAGCFERKYPSFIMQNWWNFELISEIFCCRNIILANPAGCARLALRASHWWLVAGGV